MCTWPASIPSGVGTCHRKNSFLHLNKRLLAAWGVVEGGGAGSLQQGAGRTLAKLAVKSTHSKSCPILWRNSSTCGRFSTYTCKGRRQQAVSHAAARAGQGLGRAAARGPPPGARPIHARCAEVRTREPDAGSRCRQPSQREREADHGVKGLRDLQSWQVEHSCAMFRRRHSSTHVAFGTHLSQSLCGHRPQPRCCPGSLELAAVFSAERPIPHRMGRPGLARLQTFHSTPWRLVTLLMWEHRKSFRGARGVSLPQVGPVHPFGQPRQDYKATWLQLTHRLLFLEVK